MTKFHLIARTDGKETSFVIPDGDGIGHLVVLKGGKQTDRSRFAEQISANHPLARALIVWVPLGTEIEVWKE